jgi:hypothetical protein
MAVASSSAGNLGVLSHFWQALIELLIALFRQNVLKRSSTEKIVTP